MNLFTMTGAADGERIGGESVAGPLSRWSEAARGPYRGREAILGVRAEDLHLDAAAAGAGGGRIRGRVFAVEPLGAETLLAVETEGGVECTARLPRDVTARPGELVELHFSASAGYLFDKATGKAVPADAGAAVAAPRPMLGTVQ